MDTPVSKNTTEDKPKTKLLDRVRDVFRLKYYSIRAERTYCDWTQRFIRFRRRHSRFAGKIESYLQIRLPFESRFAARGISDRPTRRFATKKCLPGNGLSFTLGEKR